MIAANGLGSQLVADNRKLAATNVVIILAITTIMQMPFETNLRGSTNFVLTMVINWLWRPWVEIGLALAETAARQRDIWMSPSLQKAGHLSVSAKPAASANWSAGTRRASEAEALPTTPTDYACKIRTGKGAHVLRVLELLFQLLEVPWKFMCVISFLGCSGHAVALNLAKTLD